MQLPSQLSAHEIETARLRLRMFTLRDTDDYFLLRSDPEVMRYIGTGATSTREQTTTKLSWVLMQWEKHGFGIWAVVDKKSENLIGWAGLSFLDSNPEIEVGYGLAKAYWGTGMATEAAWASLRYGFEELQLDRIVAVAVPENAASQRVMEKAGMRYVKLAHYYGVDVAYYEITRESFRPGTSLYILRKK